MKPATSHPACGNCGKSFQGQRSDVKTKCYNIRWRHTFWWRGIHAHLSYFVSCYILWQRYLLCV